MIGFGREITGDVETVMCREWLVTNGIGGYAMGTPAGARTRRYHGLLTAALQPPALRTMMVAAVDTWVAIGDVKYPLCTHEWAAGVLLPDGYRHLERFYLDANIPTWVWAIGDLRIVQRLWMADCRNTTYVTYEYQRGTHPISLQLTPLVTYRDHHHVTKGGAAIRTELNTVENYRSVTIHVPPGPNLPVTRTFQVMCNADTAQPTNEWWWSFHLARDAERGLASGEDLFATSVFTKELQPGKTMVLICTAERDNPVHWRESLASIRQRDTDLMQQAKLNDAPEWIQQLAFAADQFLVDRPISGEAGESVIAGYPWFLDWSRDTMISLPGLTLAVHRPDIAAKVLKTFAHVVDQGMLPNRFPDDGQSLEYNTADGTLWYFEAIRAYLAYRDDPKLTEALYPVLKGIIDWHVKGTRFNIHVDPKDGLLHIGEPGTQLTWMDVKIDSWVVTPRIGKPVEINALWYNALCVMADLAQRLSQPEDQEHYKALADRAKASFNARFWSAEDGYLYDVIDTPDGDDASLRPNQLIAVSLANAPVDEDKARAVVDICARELVTSFGLRSLGPQEHDYTGHYMGNVFARDSAYHQGTAWSWLIGPFVSAHYKVYKNAVVAYSYLEPFRDHLNDYGLGTIAEIFDGDAPHAARGCIAQAWGVAEVLRVYREIEAGLNEKQEV